MPDERQDTEQRPGAQPDDAATDAAASVDTEPAPPPPVEEGPPSPVGQRSPQVAQEAAAGDGGVADEHPEYFVGGAFVGGLVLAQVLKRFGDD